MTISISKSLYSLIVRTELIKKYNTLKFCRVTIYGVLFCRATFCHATVLIDLTAFNTSCAPLNTYYFWVVGVGGACTLITSGIEWGDCLLVVQLLWRDGALRLLFSLTKNIKLLQRISSVRKKGYTLSCVKRVYINFHKYLHGRRHVVLLLNISRFRLD